MLNTVKNIKVRVNKIVLVLILLSKCLCVYHIINWFIVVNMMDLLLENYRVIRLVISIRTLNFLCYLMERVVLVK